MEEKNKLFVGNLSYTLDDAKLGEIFGKVEGAEVVEAKVITDKYSGRSKGFGFVTMKTDEMAQKAIEQMNGKDVDGRNITVNVARPRVER